MIIQGMMFMLKHNMPKVCIAGPFPPPFAGMEVQADMLVKKLTEDGVSVYPVPTNPQNLGRFKFILKIRFVRSIIQSVILIIALFRAIRHVDVIHILANSYLSFFLRACPSILIGRLYNKKIIVNYRGGAAEEFFRKWGFLAKPFLMLADAITVPSGFLQDVFWKFGVKTKIVPNISDLHQFKYKKRAKVSPRLLVTRNLEEIYNNKCVIRAFEIVKRHFPQAQLVIVGSGSEEQLLKNMVKELQLSDVIFTGKVNHDNIHQLYNDSDIMLNASNIDNMPISILEAFASGLPVVSTVAGGIPYLVKNGETGLLVPLDDHQQLAEKVIELINNNTLANTISENARKEAEKFSWDSVRRELFKVYGISEDI